MAVQPVDQYTQDPYKTATTPTTQTTAPKPVTAPQPSAYTPQPAPRTAAPAVPSPTPLSQPVMDPLAFQQQRSPYQDASGNWDVSTQAGMEAMWADRAAKESSGYYEPGGGFYQPGGFGHSDFFNDAAIQGRQSAADMTPEQRQAAFNALQAKYAGQLEQGNSGLRLSYSAPIEDQNNYDYLQQLINAGTYAPQNLPFLTSQSQIHGTSGSDTAKQQAEAPEFFARYGINDPNHVSPYEQSQEYLSILNGADPSAYRTIQGGQEFTDPAAAAAAKKLIDAQMAAGGSGIFDTLQPGGTWRDDAYQQYLAGQGGMGGTGSPSIPSTASDVGGSIPGGGSVPGGGVIAPPGSSAYGDGGDSTGSGLGPGVTPVDPENDLRSFQITPGAMLDRFKLAQEQYGTFADATSPQYQAALRDAARAAAATGRLGSGMLRTSYGDLANQRANALTTQRDTLFQNALLGSVQDAQTQFEDLMREQEYQTGAQNQAFNQAITAQQLQEQLTSGAFNRALQQMIQGYSGNPSDTQLALSNIFGNQSSAAGQALGMMLQGLAAGGGGNNAEFMKLLQQMAAGGAGVAQQGSTGSTGGGDIAWPESPFNFPTSARQPTLPVS